MTVLDAVLEAGGTNDSHRPIAPSFIARSKDKVDVFDVDLGDILKKGRLEDQPVAQTGRRDHGSESCF